MLHIMSPNMMTVSYTHLDVYKRQVVRGVILLAAVIFDRYKQKAKRAA